MTAPASKPTVFVVDDDPAVRESLQWLMESAGLRVETYPSGEAFLATYARARPGCLLLDIRMPGKSGLEIQQQLAAERLPIPIIIITGHGDVSIAVRAIKNGAIDVIEKPIRNDVLIDRVLTAMALDIESRRRRAEELAVESREALLTPRERQIMGLLVAGASSKAVAARLGLSPKTVDVHRVRILEKMQAESVPQLIRIVLDRRPTNRPG